MEMSISKKTSEVTKFICSIVILFHHVFFAFKLSNITFFSFFFMKIAMFTFLFLSGYGLVQSYYQNGLKDYWGKKFRKIYIPAVCVNIFAALELLFLNKIEHDRNFIFKDVLMLNSEQTINDYLWFLHLLLIWYIAFYFVYYYVRKKKQRLLIWGGYNTVDVVYDTGDIWFGLGILPIIWHWSDVCRVD